ncbi:MAG: hypothetical protein GYA12_11055 [Chloroflexi bacterium]|jgi:hypothetical protein|nr:hypothetical protein [Chloroflexota bacterium]BCY17817.1 hypothetical protein hrd7_16660 [Leptolinea sp. HRD-7]
MSSEKEVSRILQMIQARLITASEGVKLLDSVPKNVNKTLPKSSTQGTRPHGWIRITITDQKTGKEKVNIRLPANVVETGMKMGACYCPGVNNSAENKILDALHAGITGKVIDSIRAETGERITVSFE